MTDKGLSRSMGIWILRKCLEVMMTPINFLGVQTSLLEVMLWELTAILILDIILRIFSRD